LGWKTRGSLDAKFEEVAFELETSTTSSPKFAEAKTPFGYHIIMVRSSSSDSVPNPVLTHRAGRRQEVEGRNIATNASETPSWGNGRRSR
jgi:parvulin-like peptidyl-prolyl isomerase